MLPYGVERIESGIPRGLQSIQRVNVMERDKRYRIVTSINPDGRNAKKGIPHEQITHDHLWNKRPDGIAFKMPTTTKVEVICLMEFTRMSDVTNHYVVRAKRISRSPPQT